jgi:hypothetical protein
MEIEVNIGRKEGVFLVFLVSSFLIAGFVFAYETSFDDPSVMGHSLDELEKSRCVSAMSGVVGTGPINIDLTLGGIRENICLGPAGCDILYYTGDSGGIDVNPGNGHYGLNMRFVQVSDGNYLYTIAGQDYTGFGRNGVGSVERIGDTGIYYDCILTDSADVSGNTLVLNDTDSTRFCAVSICGREV